MLPQNQHQQSIIGSAEQSQKQGQTPQVTGVAVEKQVHIIGNGNNLIDLDVKDQSQVQVLDDAQLDRALKWEINKFNESRRRNKELPITTPHHHQALFDYLGTVAPFYASLRERDAFGYTRGQQLYARYAKTLLTSTIRAVPRGAQALESPGLKFLADVSVSEAARDCRKDVQCVQLEQIACAFATESERQTETGSSARVASSSDAAGQGPGAATHDADAAESDASSWSSSVVLSSEKANDSSVSLSLLGEPEGGNVEMAEGTRTSRKISPINSFPRSLSGGSTLTLPEPDGDTVSSLSTSLDAVTEAEAETEIEGEGKGESESTGTRSGGDGDEPFVARGRASPVPLPVLGIDGDQVFRVVREGCRLPMLSKMLPMAMDTSASGNRDRNGVAYRSTPISQASPPPPSEGEAEYEEELSQAAASGDSIAIADVLYQRTTQLGSWSFRRVVLHIKALRTLMNQANASLNEPILQLFFAPASARMSASTSTVGATATREGLRDWQEKLFLKYKALVRTFEEEYAKFEKFKARLDVAYEQAAGYETDEEARRTANHWLNQAEVNIGVITSNVEKAKYEFTRARDMVVFMDDGGGRAAILKRTLAQRDKAIANRDREVSRTQSEGVK